MVKSSVCSKFIVFSCTFMILIVVDFAVDSDGDDKNSTLFLDFPFGQLGDIGAKNTVLRTNTIISLPTRHG